MNNNRIKTKNADRSPRSANSEMLKRAAGGGAFRYYNTTCGPACQEFAPDRVCPKNQVSLGAGGREAQTSSQRSLNKILRRANMA